MAKELKIRITNPAALEQKLRDLGATFQGEEHETHTYFTQTRSSVLKLVESADGAWLIQFTRQGQGFVRTSKEPVVDPAARKRELTAAGSTIDTLNMHGRTFQLDQSKFDLYYIEGLGEFLILTADHPDPAYFIKLGPKAKN
jgi:hypothetical protein